jgi:hypothetical protein
MASNARIDLTTLLSSKGPLTWVVPRAELGKRTQSQSRKDLSARLKWAQAHHRLFELAGRVLRTFEGFDADPKAAAASFLERAGLGAILNDDLLGDFERTFAAEHA